MTTCCLVCMIVFALFCMNTNCNHVAFAANSGSKKNETDRLSLLAFREQVTLDPNHVLDSWNTSLHFCSWPGITFSSKHRRVIIFALELRSQGLGGCLTSQLGNLTFLTLIDLANNSFHGGIPQEVGSLFRLQRLSLRNNSFQGESPTNLSKCLHLQAIDLANNELDVNVPIERSSLPRLIFGEKFRPRWNHSTFFGQPLLC